AGAAAARCRAADQPEPRHLPDTEETVMRLVAPITGIALGLAAAVAAAQTPAIDQARAAGQVGERYDGYLGMSANAPATLRNQVAAINIRRRSLYSNFATSHQVTLQEVGITAGCQLLARVEVGEVYLLSDNAWRRRAPGQSVALPTYCR
ncbi:MAG: YdbL family protein, partial [Sphingomicrobium sp.]